MANKLELEIKAGKVDIKTIWSILTEKKAETLKESLPDLIVDAQILEGGHNGGIRVGSIVSVTILSDDDLSNRTQFLKEKVVELDAENYFLKFEYFEGVFIKAIDHYSFTIKLDSKEEDGNSIVTIASIFTFDVNKAFTETFQLKEAISKVLSDYFNGVLNYLQKNYD